MLLLSLGAEAANYTVKQAGGGNYTTIQACANAMANGDTCTVYAGTYNEHVAFKVGGVGAYKTLQVNGTDLVYVLDFTLLSHNKLIGFHVQNPASPHSSDCITVSAGATDVFITSNNLYACGGNHAALYGNSTGSSYVYVQNNTISYPCTTSTPPTNPCLSMQFNGNHWLVENNDISHSADGITYLGTYHVIRGNNFHDNYESECVVGGNGGNCHIDGFESEPPFPTQFNLIECNTIVNNIGPNGHGYLSQGDSCAGQCHHLIIRYNLGAHVGSGGVVDDNARNSTVNPGFYHVKSYNNTWVDFSNDPSSQSGGITNYYSFNSINAAQINDIFYYGGPLVNYNPYADDASTDATFVFRNNLAWCVGADTGGTCNLHSHIYGKGNFTDDPGNIKANPLLVNYAANDFRLAAGSPALGAGSYLTTVAAGDSGSGTTLLVNDAGFFQDGHGLSGVKPDGIRVGTTTVVQIASVNYATNTLVLANSITRSPGDPVYLFSDSNGRTVLFGNAPDFGALPSGLQQTPAPPTALTVKVS